MPSLIASFLKRLLSPRRSPPPSSERPVYPLGLNQEQVDSLRRLASTPQWRTYTEALQAVCETEFARILSGLPHDQYLMKTGRVQALMEVLTLPDTLDQKAQEIDEHSRTAAERATNESTGRDASRILATLGSPYFRASR